MSDFHPLGFRLMATALARADTRDLLPTIRVPTLLIWGDADARSPMAVAHQLRDAIPLGWASALPRHAALAPRPSEDGAAIAAVPLHR